MFRIKTLNQISPTGLSVLDASRFTVSDGVENEDGVLVRSADMQEYVFPPRPPGHCPGRGGHQQHPRGPLL